MSSGGALHGSSMAPHSTARPTMFSSTEYGLASETVIGMSKRAAYSMESRREKPHMRTGANTSRSGASVRSATSNRTWSFPLPVQPCATASAPNSRAAATRWRAITGRDSDDTSGYLPSYSALALIAFTTKRAAYSSRASTTRASIAPATSARWRMASQYAASACGSWPTSTARATTSAPHSSWIHLTATEVSSPPEYASTTRFAISSLLFRSRRGARRDGATRSRNDVHDRRLRSCRCRSGPGSDSARSHSSHRPRLSSESGERGHPAGHGSAAHGLRTHEQQGVVTGDGPEHIGQPGAVERGGHHVR